MQASIKIFVEGSADKNFLLDYISYINSDFKINDDTIIVCGGWMYNNEMVRNEMNKNIADGGLNIIVFDADDNFNKKSIEINNSFKDIDFKLFLFPNNEDIGALEDLLEQIIVDKNKPIFDCWQSYEDCLKSKRIFGRIEPLTIPSKKAKIYAYLETLLGASEKEKKMIKIPDYKNKEHWNLNSSSLDALKNFLQKHLS